MSFVAVPAAVSAPSVRTVTHARQGLVLPSCMALLESALPSGASRGACFKL